MQYRSKLLIAVSVVGAVLVAAFLRAHLSQDNVSIESQDKETPANHAQHDSLVDTKQQGVDKLPDQQNRFPSESNLIDGYVISRTEDWVPISRVRRNCFDRPDPATGNLEFSCDVVTEYDHPYGLFSYEQLASIADVDAEASFILGHRLFSDPSLKSKFDYEEAVGYLLNAAVLSDESQPYLAMLRARGLPETARINGKLDVMHAKEAYVWTKAGVDSGLLPPSNGSLNWLVSTINSSRYENDGVDLAVWDQEANGIREYIQSQRAQRTGK